MKRKFNAKGIRQTKLSKSGAKSTAFLLPVILVGASLNMGLESCTRVLPTCDNWSDSTHRRLPCSPRVFRTTRDGDEEESHSVPAAESYSSNEPLLFGSSAPNEIYVTGDVRGVSWRGDPTLELELLGGPAFSRTPAGVESAAVIAVAPTFAPEGPLNLVGGYAITVPWNRGSLSGQVADIDVHLVAETFWGITHSEVAIFTQEDNQRWFGAHTARVVDRGWCSGIVPWEGELIDEGTADEEYIPGIADYLRTVFYIEFASILGQAPDTSIRGISVLSDHFMPGIIVDGEGEAGFEFRPKLRIWGEGPLGNSRGADVEFRLWVTLDTGSTGEIIATVDVFDFEVSNGEVAGDEIASALEGRMPDLTVLSTLLTDKLAGSPFAIRRMIARPSGLELVLAETLADEQRPDAQLAAVFGAPPILSSPGTPGLPIEIGCQEHEECPGCTRPEPTDLKSEYYGLVELPPQEQWFPIAYSSVIVGSCGDSVFQNGLAVSACVRGPSILDELRLLRLTLIEGAPVGVKLKICYFDLPSLAQSIVQMPWVIDSGYYPDDPDCGEMGGSVVIKKVDP